MTELPDYAVSPFYTPVHTEPPRSAQWEAMSQDQIEQLRARLIESIIQVVVQAITGLFTPGGGIGDAFDQLTSWAESISDALADVPIVGDIITDIVEAITGILGGDLDDLTAYFDDALQPIEDLIEALFGGSSILSTILPDIIPGLDASKIISGFFPWVMTGAQDIAEAITGALGRPDISGFDPVDAITEVLQAISSIYVTGWGGPGNAAETWQATWDNLVGGIVGTIGTGSTLSDLFNSFFEVSSNAMRGLMSFDILGIRNNRATWRGMLPSSDTTLSLNSLMFNKVSGTPTAPTINVPVNTSLIAWEIVQQAGDKQVVQWHGSGNTGLTDFRVRIWKMNTITGNTTCVHTSASAIGSVGSSLGVNTYTMPAPINFAAGEIFGIEWHPIGSGAGHNIVGDTTWVTYNHPTIFPRRKASTRASGTSTTTPADVASPTYVNTIPLVEFAVSTGNPAAPQAPVLYTFGTVGSSAIPVPDWANTVQLIVVSGGGKGATGGAVLGINGNGGNGGTFGSLILTRGTHFTTGAIVNYTIGAGAIANTGAGTSSASVGANSVSRPGGANGSGVNLGMGLAPGWSPGSVTVDGVPYIGGAQQNTLRGNGNAAGGGGAGGSAFQSGGNGARGGVWVRFKQ